MLKKKLVLGLSVAAVCLTVAAAGCAPQAQESAQLAADDNAAAMDSGLMPLAEWQVNPSDNPDDYLEDIYDGYQQRADANQPKVIEMADGAKVQRTPTPARDSTANLKSYISWNTYRLDADNRGCKACHENLDELVQNIHGVAHTPIDNLGIDTEVHQCMACHETHLGGRYQSQFSGLIHEIHNNNKMFEEEKNGSCWSCHYGYITPEGSQMALWDEVKHNVLRGINTIKGDALTGEFSYDQDYCQSPDEPLWTYNYAPSPGNQEMATRWGQWDLGLEPDPANDGVYDSWAVVIDGAVDNPTTMTLAELIEAIPSETRVMQVQCANNGANSTYITQREVTGIPISAIAELVGAHDGIGTLGAESSDGRTAEVDYNWVKDHGALLVYEVDGKPLSYASGYPIQLWIAGWVADEFNKNVVGLEFLEEEYKAPVFYQGAYSTKLGVKRQPVAGTCYLYEGQVIPVGQPFTFQGYASSIGHAVANVEISFDHGATWATFETPNNDLTKWTWWNYTWTPEEEGCYCIMVRCTDDQGIVTPDPHEYMVNVQAAA